MVHCISAGNCFLSRIKLQQVHVRYVFGLPVGALTLAVGRSLLQTWSSLNLGLSQSDPDSVPLEYRDRSESWDSCYSLCLLWWWCDSYEDTTTSIDIYSIIHVLFTDASSAE